MKYTYTLPTEPGWYWFRETVGDWVRVTIVHIGKTESGAMIFLTGRCHAKITEYPGEWAGPIQEPEDA